MIACHDLRLSEDQKRVLDGLLSKFFSARQPRAFSSEVEPVRVKKTRQIKNLEPRFDSIETEKALAQGFGGDMIGP
jgi:hypothetical protein